MYTWILKLVKRISQFKQYTVFFKTDYELHVYNIFTNSKTYLQQNSPSHMK